MKRTWVADMANRHCAKLSKGYKQRVGLAQAIIHNPDVLVLDEPTAGLDPKQIIETRQLIRELAGNHTIVLSTHILPEVSQTCQRVVIINKGKVVAVDTPDNLTARLRGAVTMYRAGDGPADEVQGALQNVSGVTRVTRADANGRRRHLRSGHARRASTCAASWPRPSSRAAGDCSNCADADEPRGHLPQPHHRENRRTRPPSTEEVANA